MSYALSSKPYARLCSAHPGCCGRTGVVPQVDDVTQDAILFPRQQRRLHRAAGFPREVVHTQVRDLRSAAQVDAGLSHRARTVS